MKKNSKRLEKKQRLSLRRETIRTLSTRALSEAIGGAAAGVPTGNTNKTTNK